MQILLRKLSIDETGAEEYVETELAGDTLVLGSAPECDIALLGPGVQRVHAQLEKRGAKIRMSAGRDAKLIHNGKVVQSADLKAGDHFEMGGQKFSCFAPPRGFDLGLQWQQVEQDGGLLADGYRTSLDALHFSLRKVSWTLALLVIIATGAAPLLHYFYGNTLDAPAASPESSVDHQLTPESLWSSGPLLPAHQVTIGNDCSVCHEAPFVAVQDQACEACHGDLPNHVNHADASIETQNQTQSPNKSQAQREQLDTLACRDCHKEHNEPQSIVTTSDSLCSNCHQHIEPAVRGFSVGRHPEFQLSLLQPETSGTEGMLTTTWTLKSAAWTHTPTGSATSSDTQVKENSQLKYPHDLHMDINKVTHAQRGDRLQCVDCHVLSSDGEHFEPIAMETQCIGCHSLTFDARYPKMQLPHGSVDEVYRTLESHYARLAFEPVDANTPQRRRLPGREDINDHCDKDFDCAKRQAKRMEESQFTRQGCVTCHEIRQWADANGTDHWQVLPVKLNRDWYANARFDHKSHLPQAELSGDALCLSCHQADTSNASTDILLPDLALCTDCHGDQAVDNRVPLNCVACHGFHGLGTDLSLPGVDHVSH
jgi:predicted CXXCH cytochrome family protein